MDSSLGGLSVALLLTLSPGQAGAGGQKEEGVMPFDGIVWVQRKAPQISLLYLVVPERSAEVARYNELVVQYAKDALRAADRITAKDAKGVPWFAGKFNV